MKIIVYAIYNQHSDKIYIGQTADLQKRMKRHNKLLTTKSTSYTSKIRGEWSIIYTETFYSRPEAMKREKELKSYQGRKFIKNLIKTMGR